MIRSRALLFVVALCSSAAGIAAPAPTGYAIEGAQLASLIAGHDMWYPQEVLIDSIVNYGDGDGTPGEAGEDLVLQVWASDPATPAVPARPVWSWHIGPITEGYERIDFELSAFMLVATEAAWNLELRLFKLSNPASPVATATLATFDEPVALRPSESGDSRITVPEDVSTRLVAGTASFDLDRDEGKVMLTLEELKNLTGSETIGPVVVTLFAVTGVTDNRKLEGYVLGRRELQSAPGVGLTLAPHGTFAGAGASAVFQAPPPDGYPVVMIVSETGNENEALDVLVFGSTFLEPVPDEDGGASINGGGGRVTTTSSSSSSGGSFGLLALFPLLLAGLRRRGRFPH